MTSFTATVTTMRTAVISQVLFLPILVSTSPTIFVQIHGTVEGEGSHPYLHSPPLKKIRMVMNNTNVMGRGTDDIAPRRVIGEEGPLFPLSLRWRSLPCISNIEGGYHAPCPPLPPQSLLLHIYESPIRVTGSFGTRSSIPPPCPDCARVSTPQKKGLASLGY